MNIVTKIYSRLYHSFGPQHWWPGESVQEIIIGAILTQNTNWQNVEKAILNLKKGRLLSLERISRASLDMIAELIRPSGYYNVKAKRLKAVSEYFAQRCRCDFTSLEPLPLETLRHELLAVYGVGLETADSILLYALNRPVFVVDAYTRRIGHWHGLFKDNLDYDSIRVLFESSLPDSIPLFNEYHALLVRLGKEFCRPKPRCDSCPLNFREYFHPQRGTFFKKNHK